MLRPREPYPFCPICTTKMHLKNESISRCPQCTFTDWNNPIPVVACLVIHEDHAILARNHKWPPGMFSVISGFLEFQESPLDCARRETLEELNLQAQSIEWIDSMMFFELNQIILGYSVIAKGEIKLNTELAEIKRIPIPNLKGWEFGTGILVKRFLEKNKAAKPVPT